MDRMYVSWACTQMSWTEPRDLADASLEVARPYMEYLILAPQADTLGPWP